MAIKEILEYQRIDQELLALENQLAKSPERQRFLQATAQVKAAEETISKLNREANELFGEYNAIKSKLDELKEELDGFDGILDEVQDPAEAEHYLKLVGAISEQMNALEKALQALGGKLDRLKDSYSKTFNQGKSAVAAQRSAKAAYDAKREELAPRAEEIQRQLKELATKIPEKLLAAYEALRAARKMPAVVPYDVKQSNCGGCRMEVANNIRARLKNPGDMAECPNCRRIMYVPEE